MNRILNWFYGSEEQPSYYMERDYTPTHVRIHACVAPSVGDLEVDIRDDGVSIFANLAQVVSSIKEVYSEIQYGTHSTTAILAHETVTGQTYGATGVVVSNALGILKLTRVSSTSFTVGESILGSISGGTATVDSFYRGGKPETFSQDEAKTIAILAKMDTLNEMAEDFLQGNPPIEAGSLVTCHIIKRGGANSITVQLELESLDEESEETD